jgi:hypothetical protein
LSFFDLVLLIGGAIGIVGGTWPLLTGRNYPGMLGRGFTRGDNLRLERAPAIYFRAMGATIVTSGLVILCVGALILLSAGPPSTNFTPVAVLAGVALISFAGSLAALIFVTYRHKLFRWNAP